MRRKRALVWLLMVVLIVTSFPIQPMQTVEANNAAYFLPDDLELRSTANMNINNLTRNNAYVADTKTLNIRGAFQSVAADSLSVRVEQLNYVSGSWKTVNEQYYETGITTSNNKFEANLNLFSGFNKVTFKGIQGSITREDVFYILYDDAPYIVSLQVSAGNDEPVNLSEGTAIVVTESEVYIEGNVQNATRLSINGNLASLLEDGTFFAPIITLRPGKNKIDFTIENQANKLEVSRTIFYYDELNPFNDVQLNYSGKKYNILNQVPSVSGLNSNATLEIEMLLPNYSGTIGDNATVIRVNGNIVGMATTPTPNEQEMIGTDINNNIYKLVKFTTDNYNLQTDGTSILTNQTVSLNVYRDLGNGTNFSTSKNMNFTWLGNQVIINNIWLLPNYNGSGNFNNTTAKVNLNRSQVDSGNFYVAVEANQDITLLTPDISLTSGLSTINIQKIDGITTDENGNATNNIRVYRVSGMPEGSQTLKFQYPNSSFVYNANVNYVSKSHIFVEEIYDGQTIEIDSRADLGKNLIVNGEIIDTDNAVYNFEIFLNGIKVKSADCGVDNCYSYTNSTRKFDLKLVYGRGEDGRLQFGENRLNFIARMVGSDGQTIRELTKDIRLYVLDKNISTIEKYLPVQKPTGNRAPIDATDIDDIIFVSPDIQNRNDIYVTSLTEHDIVLKGAGATGIRITRGGELIFDLDGLTAATQTTTAGTNNGTIYDFHGSEAGFILRLRDLNIEDPGTYVYIVELRNAIGARATQRLEVLREVEAFRILAPQPTVGNQYVVNKNFLRFDIETEGADRVTINGQEAKRKVDNSNRFVYDFVGLRPGRSTKINIEVATGNNTSTRTIEVQYVDTVQLGTQFMEDLSNRHRIFNKDLELSFPKNTVLKTTTTSDGVIQLYPSQKILFGIADPKDGVVERKDDYGNIKGQGQGIPVPERISRIFTSDRDRQNFTRVSPIYWISGGLAEQGNLGSTNYKPAVDGLPPFSNESNYTEYPSERKLVPTNRGELTIKFDDNVVDQAGILITVFYFNDSGEWKNIGGEVNTKNNTITVPFDEFGYYMVAKLRYGFQDITMHPWARDVLEALFAKGFMRDLRYAEFGTDDYATRGEFATMIVKALNMPLNYDDNYSFFDVRPTARGITWDYGHIETAARAGIIRGVDTRTFAPNQRLTREQAATMIARALELRLQINDDRLATRLKTQFTDFSSMSYYALPSIQAVNQAGIMQGRENQLQEGQRKASFRFDPRANLTRAELGAIAVRMIQKNSKIFPKTLN